MVDVTWRRCLGCKHPEVTSVLITGGDPMIMSASVLRRYIEPLLDPSLGHLESIRIGTKSLAYWPQRYVTDPDADETLRLFGEVTESGRTLALMAHFSHSRELEPAIAVEAARRVRDTGAVIRTQAPLIRSVNDDPATWQSMWRTARLQMFEDSPVWPSITSPTNIVLDSPSRTSISAWAVM